MSLLQILGKKDIDIDLFGKKHKTSFFRDFFLGLSLITLYSLASYIGIVDRDISRRNKNLAKLKHDLSGLLENSKEVVETSFNMKFKEKPMLQTDLNSALECIASQGISGEKNSLIYQLKLEIKKLFRAYPSLTMPSVDNEVIRAFSYNGSIHYVDDLMNRIEPDDLYTLLHECGHCYVSQVNPDLHKIPKNEKDFVLKCVDEGAAEYVAATALNNLHSGIASLRIMDNSARRQNLLKQRINIKVLRKPKNQCALGYGFFKELLGKRGYIINGVNIFEKALQNPPTSIEELVHPKNYAERLLRSLGVNKVAN